MLNTWGGHNGKDHISDDEYEEVGYDKAREYCRKYCWDDGIGYCFDCAYFKEKERRGIKFK